jgi:hypothetical protein
MACIVCDSPSLFAEKFPHLQHDLQGRRKGQMFGSFTTLRKYRAFV